MRIGIFLNYAGGFAETVVELADYERAGADIVFVPEAYSFDAVSQLGFIAAKTERMQIASGILPLYSRTPALLAMTAAGLDYVSGGRFTLGLGASGPQVIEGWHGVPYDAPIGRSREIIEICRMVWRRDRLAYQGKYYHLPLEGGTGLGKPLKLINHPVRERIPVALAAIGPKNVTVAAELAESWMPIFYLPEKAGAVWGEAVAEGRAKRDPALGPLDVIAHAPLAIGDDVDHITGLRDLSRPQLALYIGGMGARGRNFYNDLARRFGYEAEAKAIQDAYLDGRKAEAEALVPAELVEQISLIGPAGYVAERLAAFRESGVTTLNVTPLAPTHEARVRLIEQVRALADKVPVCPIARRPLRVHAQRFSTCQRFAPGARPAEDRRGRRGRGPHHLGSERPLPHRPGQLERRAAAAGQRPGGAGHRLAVRPGRPARLPRPRAGHRAVHRAAAGRGDDPPGPADRGLRGARDVGRAPRRARRQSGRCHHGSVRPKN